MEGGQPRRMIGRRAELAFGVLTIAIARLIGAHAGLNSADVMPE
jgi:hypothetical protein